MKKTVIFLCLVQFFTLTSFSDIPENYYSALPVAPVSTYFLQANNINLAISNDGILSYDRYTFTGGSAGFIWPVAAAQRLTMDYAAGLWIGAKVGTSRELRLAAALYSSHYSPGNIPVIGQVPGSGVCNDPQFKPYIVNLQDPSFVNGGSTSKIAGGRTYVITYDSWASWPVNLGAPYVEVNGTPGYQPSFNGDRPGIWHTTARPDEIVFTIYMDYKNCTNSIHASEISLPGGTLPLGVEIQQITFSFQMSNYNNMYFTKYRIFNKSNQNWDSVYISLVDDGDIGGGDDDAAGCDSVRDTGFIYNFDNNDIDYGAAPPALGYRILQSPMRFTGSNLDTARLPYGNFIGYRLTGMSSYNVFVNNASGCYGDPITATSAYNFMRGKDGCGNTMFNWTTGGPTMYRFNGDAHYRTGWYDSTQGDKRQILNCGPFSLNPGQDQFLVAGIISARGSYNYQSVGEILSSSDVAKSFYNSSFGGTPIGISPVSTEVPRSFNLEQNYPNPFNPVTKFKFSIPVSGNVSLKIYDVSGREVTELVNKHMQAGTYEADWDASSFSSGIYLYTIISGDFTQTRKMVMIK
jgi:hypothetical protein